MKLSLCAYSLVVSAFWSVAEGKASLRTAVLYPRADVGIVAGDATASTTGDMIVGANAEGKAHRALVSFDLSSLPSDAQISEVSVTMRVYPFDKGGEEEPEIKMHPVKEAWTAEDVTFSSSKYDEDIVLSKATSINGGNAHVFPSTPELKGAIEEWIASDEQNFGVILVGPETEEASYRRYHSFENKVESRRPTMIVKYTAGNKPTSKERQNLRSGRALQMNEKEGASTDSTDGVGGDSETPTDGESGDSSDGDSGEEEVAPITLFWADDFNFDTSVKTDHCSSVGIVPIGMSSGVFVHPGKRKYKDCNFAKSTALTVDEKGAFIIKPETSADAGALYISGGVDDCLAGRKQKIVFTKNFDIVEGGCDPSGLSPFKTRDLSKVNKCRRVCGKTNGCLTYIHNSAAGTCDMYDTVITTTATDSVDIVCGIVETCDDDGSDSTDNGTDSASDSDGESSTDSDGEVSTDTDGGVADEASDSTDNGTDSASDSDGESSTDSDGEVSTDTDGGVADEASDFDGGTSTDSDSDTATDTDGGESGEVSDSESGEVSTDSD